MSEGYYDFDCPGLWRRSIELRRDGTVAGDPKAKFWRKIPLRGKKGAALVDRLGLEDKDKVVLYLLDPSGNGWSGEFAGKTITLSSVPQPVETGGYNGPRGMAQP